MLLLMLDVYRLRVLLEFAERGTIAATAAALGYTPSAVSQQLAALERETGAALLDRTARTAELTEAGRQLAGHAAEILARIEAAEADLASPEPVGRVAISAFPTAAVAFAPALTRTVRANPGVGLDLRQTAGGEVLRQVRVGQADVAIVDDWSGSGRLGPTSRRCGFIRCSPTRSCWSSRAGTGQPTIRCRCRCTGFVMNRGSRRPPGRRLGGPWIRCSRPSVDRLSRPRSSTAWRPS